MALSLLARPQPHGVFAAVGGRGSGINRPLQCFVPGFELHRAVISRDQPSMAAPGGSKLIQHAAIRRMPPVLDPDPVRAAAGA